MNMWRQTRQHEESPERTFTEADYHPHRHGRYLTPGIKMMPLEELSPLLRSNLCTECGVRVWERDYAIHDAWHDRIDAALGDTANG